MKNALFIIFCLISVISLAETKFDSLSYWTNFDDEDVKDDFVPCSVAEDKYPGPSTHARHSFEDGVLLMESAYDKKVAVALIEGGAQSEEEVLIQYVHEMVDGKEVWIRHVKRITALYDVSIVTHPAYEQTTVATREQADEINAAIEAQLKREQHQETEEEKQAREAKEREANGGETNAEKEARELAEREQKEREAVAVMRMRRNRLALQNRDIETFSY
jgi:hypothetical protein